jgi:hypothetical protein
MPDRGDDARVRALLGTPRVIAVVGMSPDRSRPSNEVGLYLRDHGHTIVPVHPKASEIEGLATYPDLRAIPPSVKIDLVDLFVGGERTAAVVEQAAAIGARAVWFQPGAEHPATEQRARDLGLDVYSGKCTMAEHRRLFG